MLNGIYDCNRVKEMLASGAKLIDVRTPNEYAQGALPGALNIPLQTIPGVTSQFKPDETLLVYCRSGSRSMFAQQYLQRVGFKDVHNIGAYGAIAPCLNQKV